MGCSGFEGTETGTCQPSEGTCFSKGETDAFAILHPVSLTDSVLARIQIRIVAQTHGNGFLYHILIIKSVKLNHVMLSKRKAHQQRPLTFEQAN